jgi:hypothetical protein
MKNTILFLACILMLSACASKKDIKRMNGILGIKEDPAKSEARRKACKDLAGEPSWDFKKDEFLCKQ